MPGHSSWFEVPPPICLLVPPGGWWGLAAPTKHPVHSHKEAESAPTKGTTALSMAENGGGRTHMEVWMGDEWGSGMHACSKHCAGLGKLHATTGIAGAIHPAPPSPHGLPAMFGTLAVMGHALGGEGSPLPAPNLAENCPNFRRCWYPVRADVA